MDYRLGDIFSPTILMFLETESKEKAHSLGRIFKNIRLYFACSSGPTSCAVYPSVLLCAAFIALVLFSKKIHAIKIFLIVRNAFFPPFFPPTPLERIYTFLRVEVLTYEMESELSKRHHEPGKNNNYAWRRLEHVSTTLGMATFFYFYNVSIAIYLRNVDLFTRVNENVKIDGIKVFRNFLVLS